MKLSKEDFLEWFEREKNKRKQDRINREALDRINGGYLNNRSRLRHLKNERKRNR